jgi:predicted GNAT superfamily acetyltransferase
VLLRELQTLLARINDAAVAEDVRDYLITDRAQLGRWHAPSAASETPEALVVAEEDGALDMGLYLDPALLERLSASAPLARLDDDNLEDFCTALEGVSHFNCVAWCAARGWSVSLLGLEMQAEIDKYAAAVLLAGSQRGGALARGLYGQLFERVRFRDDLDAALKAVYLEANRYAARFCRRLEDRFLRRREARVPEMLVELRRFYRLGDAGKLRAIEAV